MIPLNPRPDPRDGAGPTLAPLRLLGLHTPRPDEVVVLLREEVSGRGLALALPSNEAERLRRAMGLGSCPCVPVYELIEDLLRAWGLPLVHVRLRGDERGITAALVLGSAAGAPTLGCHPADALALAARARAPILAEGSALAHACWRPAAPERADQEPSLRAWLARVQPGDFTVDP